MSFPRVGIDNISITENNFVDHEGYVYNTAKLIEASKGLEVFEIPLVSIDLTVSPFRCDNLDYFIFQVNRVRNTDLKYPILLSDKGQIADGWHRISKAILLGKTTIKAKRFVAMPEPDSKEE